MNIYSLYTPSHKILYENYFLKTLSKDFTPHILEYQQQDCPTASYYSTGWGKITAKKIEIFIQACLENFNDYFFYCDVDVQFFDINLKDILLTEIGDNDIACQDDIHSYNSGVFICKANSKTLSMFEKMKINFQGCDQKTLNRFLRMCKHKKLSRRFFTTGFVAGLSTNKKITIPSNIVLHHANWIVGVENKIKTLDMIRNLYDNR